MNNYIKIDIVDNDYEKETERVMDTYIIVISNDESSFYKEKLKELQEMLRDRHDEENAKRFEFSVDDISINEITEQEACNLYNMEYINTLPILR